MERFKMCLRLFLGFFKIGLFTFGGGYAMLSLIDSECVEKKKWLTRDELLSVTAVAESTPGPIAINCATYVGYRQGGVVGSVAATIGTVLPSVIIIYLISLIFDDVLEVKLIASAFKGIKVAVGVMIINAGVKMFMKMRRTALSVAIAAAACGALLALDIFSVGISTVWLILAAAAAGWGAYAIGRLRSGKGAGK